MRGKLWRHFFLDLLKGWIRVARRPNWKKRVARDQAVARFFEAHDRVFERRFVLLIGDRFGFLLFLRDSLLQRRLEMFVLDLVEGRILIGQSAFRQQWVIRFFRDHVFLRCFGFSGVAVERCNAANYDEQCDWITGAPGSWRQGDDFHKRQRVERD